METPIEYKIGVIKGMSMCIGIMNKFVQTITDKPMKTFEIQYLATQSANAMMDLYDDAASSIHINKKGE